jgi:hypothetical protein
MHVKKRCVWLRFGFQIKRKIASKQAHVWDQIKPVLENKDKKPVEFDYFAMEETYFS